MRSDSRWRNQIRQPRPQRQKGAVAVLVGLTMAVMVGFAGLALDLGQMYVVKTELQNSVDACALAAAQALTGANSNQLAVAEAAGITTGQRHKVWFQKNVVTMQVNDNVTFSPDNTAGSFVTKAGVGGPEALAMRYARCTAVRSDIKTWFIQVLNVLPGVQQIGDQQVSASAVAALKGSASHCSLPVAICSTELPAGTVAGKWLTGALGSSDDQNLTGSFKWVDFTPPNGGAAELAGYLTGNGSCEVPATGTKVGQPGAIQSLANDWNSRFGIYQGNVRIDDAAPDFSGYAYTDAAASWPSQFNAFNDFTSKRGSRTAYQGDALTGLKTQGSISDTNTLALKGRDRRLMPAPVIDCSGLATSQVTPVISWACVFLLHPINNSGGKSGGKSGGQNGTGTGETRMYLEYRGNASAPGSPCVTYGVVGGNGNGSYLTTLVR